MPTHKPIAVLLVFPTDGTPSPNRPDPSFFADLFVNDPASLHNYWLDASDKHIDLEGTKVFGWRSHGLTRAAFKALSRANKIIKAVDAFANAANPADRVDLTGFDSVSVFGDPADELGSSGIFTFNLNGTNHNFGTSIFDIGTSHNIIAHELGHGFGFDHSFDDSPTAIDPADDNRPGAYGDKWDVMSAGNVFGFWHPRFGTTGPTINTAMRDIAGWLDSSRIVDGHSLVGGEATIFDVNDHKASHPHVMKLDEFFFEFRMDTNWDEGFSAPSVQVRVRDFNVAEHSKILHFNKDFGPSKFEMHVGDDFEVGSQLDIFSRHLKVHVKKIDTAKGSATLEVSYKPARPIPVVGPGMIFGGVASDGGGWIIINGHFYRVPPRSPMEAVLESLGAIASADLVHDRGARSELVKAALESLSKEVKALGKEVR